MTLITMVLLEHQAGLGKSSLNVMVSIFHMCFLYYHFLTIGIFMITSWLLLATSGIFFAAWMKPVLPDGEWFIAHRLLMIGSLIVGVLGFMLPFIANAHYVVPGFLYFSVS